MSVARLLVVGWWLQLKIRSRSAFDSLLSILWPLIFSTSIFLVYRQQTNTTLLLAAAIGASVMGVWSSATNAAASTLQQERRQGTLELLVIAPRPLWLTVIPVTLSMATIGIYSLVATLLWGRFVLGIHIVVDDIPGFALACLVTAISVAAMGFLLALSAVRYRSSWALGAALELPIWLICGFVVPFALLPHWVQPLSWVLPISWGVDAVKAAAIGASFWGDLGICILTSAAYLVVGAFLSTRLVDSARAQATLSLV